MTSAEQLLADPAWRKDNSRWRWWAWASLPWVAFMWIGMKAGRRPWIGIGLLYSLPFSFLMLFTDDQEVPGIAIVSDTAYEIASVAFVVTWIIGAFHVQKVRDRYLELYAPKAAQKFRAFPTPFHAAYPPPPPPVDPNAYLVAPEAPLRQWHPPAPPSGPAYSAPPLDVNAATEAQLAALPGVGAVLAKRAIELRHTSGGFTSVDEFAAALGLKPHVLERIRPHAYAAPPVTPHHHATGRVVDY